MKYLRYVCLVLALCSFLLVSCRKDEDKAITGDVKNDAEILSPDGSANVNDISATDENESEKQKIEDVEPNTVSPEELVKNFGCVLGEGGEYYDDAVSFAEAIMSGDKSSVASYTGGKSNYYEFLEDVSIMDYALYPFEFTEEKIGEMNESYVYPGAEDNYFVVFDVNESKSEEFATGKAVYYMGFELNPLSGNVLSCFVSADRAEEFVFRTYNQDYTEYFIDEFSALYFNELYDGRNYPDSFEFENGRGAHLVTHLMARCGNYTEPPYTLDEIEEFIVNSFDGNEGLDPITMDYNSWTAAGNIYEAENEDKIYGCSWGHGGISIEHEILDIETDGEQSVYKVELYADYSKFARACTLVYHFDTTQNELPLLTMVELRDNTGREIAVLSV